MNCKNEINVEKDKLITCSVFQQIKRLNQTISSTQLIFLFTGKLGAVYEYLNQQKKMQNDEGDLKGKLNN